MIERFTGEGGQRILIDALSRQSIVQGSTEIAASLAERSELSDVAASGVLMEQHASDNDLYFILAGRFSILVNGREVAERVAEQHVGEMALIDPKNKRAATVVAMEESVVARILESDFAALAEEYPSLWKNIACELGDRLRQRNELVRERNEVPRIFIGSSKESLDIANAIDAGLAADPFDVKVWTHDVFGPSEFPIEALEREAIRSDFAILVLGPDDRVISREDDNLAPLPVRRLHA